MRTEQTQFLLNEFWNILVISLRGFKLPHIRSQGAMNRGLWYHKYQKLIGILILFIRIKNCMERKKILKSYNSDNKFIAKRAFEAINEAYEEFLKKESV